MFNRLSCLYISVGNVYRRRKLTQESASPVTLLNNRDKQLHLLYGDPIFPKTVPAPVATVQDLLTVEPPPMMSVQEDRMLICEDNNPFALHRLPEAIPAEEQLNVLQDSFQEWYQAAEDRAWKDAGGTAMFNNKATGVLAVILGVGILAMVIKIVLDRDPEPVAYLLQGIFGA